MTTNEESMERDPGSREETANRQRDPMQSLFASLPQRFPTGVLERAAYTARAIASQTMRFVLEFRTRLDLPRLERALQLCLISEPILACRLVYGWHRPYWKRANSLSDINLFEVREASDPAADLFSELGTSQDAIKDPLVQAVVFRGEVDHVLLRMSHVVADGSSFKQFVYLWSRYYAELARNPEFLPVAGVVSDRSHRPIYQRLSPQLKKALFRETIRGLKLQQTTATACHLPCPEIEPAPHDNPPIRYQSLKVDAARIGRIFRYALKQRATLTQTVLAAFGQAVQSVNGVAGEGPLPIWTTVDLRRFLPADERIRIANQAGVLTIPLSPEGYRSLDVGTREVADFMKVQRFGHMGTASPTFLAETHPIVRRLVWLHPFGMADRNFPKHVNRALKKGKLAVVSYSENGEFDPDQIEFPDLADIYAMSGYANMPCNLSVNGSSFRGEFTLSLGYREDCLPTWFANKVFENIDQILPA